MKRLIFIYFLILITTPIMSQSIAELTFINIENGKLINFYDSADFILESNNQLKNINSDGKKIHSLFVNDLNDIVIRTRKMPISVSINESNYEIDVDSIESIEVFNNYKTLAGIKIGSTKQDVINAYPKYWEWSGNRIASYKDYGNKKRVFDIGMDIMYGFVFSFNEDDRVESIKMDYIITAK